MRILSNFLVLISLSFFSITFAQEHPDDLFFKARLQPISKDNIFKTEGYYNWGASIIKGKDGKYHMFYSRWKKEYSFLGWLIYSEIAHAVSKSPSGPWKYKETVIKNRRNGYPDAIAAYNPKIKYFDGKYYLYYSSTNLKGVDYTEADLLETAKTGYSHRLWKILRPNQRTFVAVSNSLDGPWQRPEKVLIEPTGPITTLTVNPAIAQGKDGKFYLVVKGDKPNEKRFIRDQAVAVSDSPAGPFVMQKKPVIDYIDTEDMSIWYDKTRDRFYGVFHTAKGFIGMVTSSDGINWKKATEYVLMHKKVPMTDDSVMKPDRLERPFVFTDENDQPEVLSLAVKKGDESYTIFIPVAAVSGEGTKVYIKQPKKDVNTVIIREDIKNEECIREYKVQALVNGKWQTVCDGQSVVNKRIQQFDTVNTNKLRLIVDFLKLTGVCYVFKDMILSNDPEWFMT